MFKKIRALRLWQKLLLSAGIIYILYLLFSFFILPRIIKNALEGPVAKQLYRDVSIKDVSFNPFTLECTIRGMKVYKEGHGTKLLDLDSVLINLEASSLFKRALIVKEFVLTGPDIRVTRYKDGSFSFSDALEKMQKIEKKRVEEEHKEPFRFSINNIRLLNGEFHFYDELEGSEHEVKDITLAIPFISNLKTKVHIFTTPKFSAIIDGTRFETDARTKPFSPNKPGEAKIRFTDLDLNRYFPYIDQLVAGNLKSGLFSADATVDFRLSDKGEPIINLYGRFDLKDLAFLDPESRKVFSMKGLSIDIAKSDIVSSYYELSAITIKEPYLMVERLKDGSINLVGLLKSEKSSDKKEEMDGVDKDKQPASPKGRKTRFILKRLTLEGGRLDFKDSANPIPFQTALKDLAVEIKDVDNQGKSSAKWRICCSLLKDADLEAAGEAWITNGSMVGVLELDGVKIPRLAPYYSPFLNGRIERGELDLDSLLFEISSREAGQPEIVFKDIDLSVDGLEVAAASGERLISVSETGLEGAAVNLAKRLVSTGRFFLKGAAVRLEIAKDGTVNLASLAAPPRPDKGESGQEKAKAGDMASANTEEKAGDSAPWTVEIPEAALSKVSIMVKDRTAPKPAEISITDLSIQAKELSTAQGRSGPLTLSATLNRNGRIKLNGTASISPVSLDGRLTAYSIPLSSFQAYIPENIRLVIAKGAAWASSKISFALDEAGGIRLKTYSDVEIKGFKALEKGLGKKFLAWKNFSVKGLQLAYAPLTLHVNSVMLERPYALMELDKEKNLNINRIFPVSEAEKGKDKGEKAAQAPQKAEKGSGSGKKKDEVPDLLVSEVLVKDGTIEVVDYSVEPFFHTELTDFTCRIAGLNSIKDKPATVEAQGRLPGNAMLNISGKFNPFAEEIYADLDLSLNNMGLTRFTPYTGKYLGYTLKKGKASLDVQLKLENKEVDLMDRIFVDQLDFGESVQSKEATSLPVKLAVALLKDRNGQIKLNIPVSGSLDDPDFSIAGAVLSVIGNLITKAATSPFSLLTAAFGADEEINLIPFEPGSTELTEEAVKRLDTLAKILKERPALQIELMGSASEDRDRHALHELKFWRLIKAQKFEDLSSKEKENTTIDDLEVTKEEYPDYLEDAYKSAPFDKPKNFLGMVKSQPVEVMEKMLREHIRITDHDLRDLANRRAQKVAEYLTGTAGVDPARVFVLEFGSRSMELPPGEPREVVEVFIK